MRKLKVYGWQSFRVECSSRSKQTREIVAASSKIEAVRLSGRTRLSELFNLCETGNKIELEVALSNPGQVFWCPLNESGRDRSCYVRAEQKTAA